MSQQPQTHGTPQPQPAEADDKDWTWVLERPCPECDADVGSLSIDEIVDANRHVADAWGALLRTHEQVRRRPTPTVWSPLEYGCHVRDVFVLFSERLDLMLNEDDPEFANWNPNETQEAERYDLQDPLVVANEVEAAGHELANRFASLSTDQLKRTGRRSDGAVFSVETFARYELHDPVHHLWDVQR